MRRYLRALVIAYAASVTLLAAWWAMQAWSYRRFVDALSRGQGRPNASPGLGSLFLDYGIPLTPLESLRVRFADLGGVWITASVALTLAACLGVAYLAGRPLSGDAERSTVLQRWARRGTLASLVLGASTLVLTWAYVRWRVLHPHYLPTVSLFLALALAEVVALATGSWLLVRGPRRAAALALMVVSLTPVALWGLIQGDCAVTYAPNSTCRR